MSRTVTITMAAALAALATGCGATTTESPASAQSPGHSPTSPSAPSSPSGTGQVGDKFTVTADIGTAVITARVTAPETDGTTEVFEGTYTVRNGVIAGFNVRRVS